jgi:hypothetical protein
LFLAPRQPVKSSKPKEIKKEETAMKKEKKSPKKEKEYVIDFFFENPCFNQRQIMHKKISLSVN